LDVIRDGLDLFFHRYLLPPKHKRGSDEKTARLTVGITAARDAMINGPGDSFEQDDDGRRGKKGKRERVIEDRSDL
jgi:hypothetical protein